MPGEDHQLPSVIDRMGVTVAWIVMLVYALSVVMPYVMALALYGKTIPSDLLEIIKSNKSTVDLITTAVVMFYFGASVQRRKDQDTLGTLVQTNAAQVAALAPVAGMNAPDTLVIPPDTTATVTPTDDGAVIQKEPNGDKL